MNVLEVIPIARGISMETLSYFTASDVVAGSIVTVPLRRKNIPALVVSVKNVADSRAEIRQSAFTLKKIEKVRAQQFLKKEYVEAAIDSAKYHAASTGSVLASLVPKNLLECAGEFSMRDTSERGTHIAAEKFAIQLPDNDRYAHYKSMVREEFARGLSVFLAVPNLADIKRAKELLEKGVESYTYILHSGLTKKEMIRTVKAILAETHPILIIGTGGFLAVPKANLGAIVIDREYARGWKIQTRPYTDLRYFAEALAKRLNIRVVFGDTLLRIETIVRQKDNELVEMAPLAFRSVPTYPQELIDMRNAKTDAEKKGFAIFSDESKNLIEHAVKKHERVFLFAARRGLSPSTLCADCGTVVKCNTCGAHTVLHAAKSGNFFLCHVCGERRDARERCTHCGGLHLTTLGIGTERIEAELKKLYPSAQIFRLDADTAKTAKQIAIVMESFYHAKGAILVGTEMALSHLEQPVENSIVVSLDTFFAIPDFRINERVMHILLALRSKTTKKLLVQTRDPSRTVFNYALTGNLIDFSKEEIDDREILKYPPFSTLIKISVAGEKNTVIRELETIQKHVAPYGLDIFPAFIPHPRGIYSANGIMKIPPNEWPKKDLYLKLISFSPDISVEVDPDSLLS